MSVRPPGSDRIPNLPPQAPGASQHQHRGLPRAVDSIEGGGCFGCVWDCVGRFFSWIYESMRDLFNSFFPEEDLGLEIGIRLDQHPQPLQMERALYSVRVPLRATYDRMRGRLSSLPEDLVSKIIFDDAENTIHFNLDEVTLRAIASRYQPFRELFGREGARLSGVDLPRPSTAKKRCHC